MSRMSVSLAVYKTLLDTAGFNALTCFVPLVAQLTLDEGNEDLGPEGVAKLCDDFERVYGLRIPHYPMISIARLGQSDGLFQLVGGKTVPNRAAIEALGIHRLREEQTVRWNALVKAFIGFAEAIGRHVSDEQADFALLRLIKSNDVEIVLPPEGPLQPDAHSTDRLELLARLFFADAYERDPESFSFLADLATCHLLASTVLHWNANTYEGGLKNLRVYIDVSPVLSLTGIEEIPARIDATVELLKLLDDLGCILCVFEHTVDEAVSLIENAAEWIDDPNYQRELAPRASRFIHERGWTKSQVNEWIASLRPRLNAANVTPTSAPAPTVEHPDEISQQELEQSIVEEYEHTGPVDMARKAKTIRRDVESIAAIYRIRNGQVVTELKSARAVLMTTNSALAHAARTFERAHGHSNSSIPACLTDRLLGTVAWLHSPAAGRTVNVKQVLADTMAAIQPTPELLGQLKKYLDARLADGSVTEQEYQAIVVDPAARRLLAQVTLNDPLAFRGQTAEEYLDAYRGIYRAEAETKWMPLSHRIRTQDAHVDRVSRTVALIAAGIVAAVFAGLAAYCYFNQNAAGALVSFVLSLLGFSAIPTAWTTHKAVYKVVRKALYGSSEPITLAESDHNGAI